MNSRYANNTNNNTNINSDNNNNSNKITNINTKNENTTVPINTLKKTAAVVFDNYADNEDESDDNDAYYDCVEFEDYAKSPPETERLKKRKSLLANANYNKNSTTPVNVETNAENVVHDYHEQQQQHHQEQHSHIRSNKPISRVQSLPIFSKSKRIQQTNDLNTSNKKLNIEIIPDIDDDIINCFHSNAVKNENLSQMDADDYKDRSEFYDRFSAVLKLILKPANTFELARTNSGESQNIASPSSEHIPQSTATTTTVAEKSISKTPSNVSIISATSNTSANNNIINTNLPPHVYSYYHYYNNQMPTIEQLQMHSKENLWYDLYDFFVNYNKRSKMFDQIKENLYKTRSKYVKKTINEILTINFNTITQSMQTDIELLLTASDYRRLNESPKYICKLSYLYCYIEDILNKVGYIESLYPSVKALELEEPNYASEEFTERIKTMLLWYNIMTNLMRQCDLFGRLLGFTKRDTYLHLWTWFDKNQNCSKRDYEKIQLLLLNNPSINLTLHTSNSWNKITPITEANSDNNISGSNEGSNTNFEEGVNDLAASSQISTLRSNSFSNTTISDGLTLSNTIKSKLATSPRMTKKFNRQVSFELHASKSTADLLYNQCSVDDIALLNHTDNGGCLNDENKSSNNNDNNFSNLNQNTDNSTLLSTASVTTTPLPQKLQRFFSYQSTLSSHKSNDSLPPSIYASLIRDSFDNNNDDAESYDQLSGGLQSTFDSTNEVQIGNEDQRDSLQPIQTIHSHSTSSVFETPNMSTQSSQHTPQSAKPSVTREKVYYEFIHKRLCKQGLPETCKKILDMIGNTLPRTRQALEINVESNNSSSQASSPTTRTPSNNITLEFFAYHWMPLHKKCRDYISKYIYDEETTKYGINCKHFKQLSLPSFRPLYLYLINCIIDLMNICMKMYIDIDRRVLEDNFSFSLLSTEQLTNECRECIEYAIQVRQYYYYMVFTVFKKTELDKNSIENDLLNYDTDLKELIKIYLNHVLNWVHDIPMTNSDALNVLENEWNFCKNNLCYVSIDEDSYAKRFCTINGVIIESIIDYLKDIEFKYKQPLLELLDYSFNNNNYNSGTASGKDETDEYNSDNDIDDDTLLASLSATKSSTQHQQHQRSAYNTNSNNSDDEDARSDELKSIHFKCNELKAQIRELRERTMKALTFCKSFMNDLELAAKYEIKSQSIQCLLNELKLTNHVLVNFSDSKQIFSNNAAKKTFMIFVPYEFANDKRQILRLLYMTSAKDDSCVVHNNLNSTNANETITSAANFSNATAVKTLNKNNSNTSNSGNFASNNSSSPSSSSNKCNDNDKIITANEDMAMRKSQHNHIRRLTSANITDNTKQNQKAFLRSLSIMAHVNISDANAYNDAIAPHTVTSTSQTATSILSGPTTGLSNSTNSLYSASPTINTSCYLLYLEISDEDQKDKFVWSGLTTELKATMEARLSTFQHKTELECSYLYLIVAQPNVLCEKRIELKRKLGGNITLIKEKTSFHPNIADELDVLNRNILIKLRCDALKFINSIEDDTTKYYEMSLINATQIFDHYHPQLHQYQQNLMPYQQQQQQHRNYSKHLIKPKFLLEIWRVCYNFGIELHTECTKFVTQCLQKEFSLGLAQFCKIWCKYVLNKTEEGYGRTTKPSWARKGFQLMNEVFKPHNSQYLTREEFNELRGLVEDCIKHVIGTKRDRNMLNPNSMLPFQHKGSFDMYDPKQRKLLKTVGATAVTSYEKSLSTSSTEGANSSNVPSLKHSHTTVLSTGSSSHMSHCQSSIALRAQEFLHEQELKSLFPPQKRFSINCRQRDENRSKILQERKLIGRVLNRQQNNINMNEAKIHVRRVDFRWQRGNKIGVGQSGIVYACVNLDSGEMMAMKEIQYKPNDLQTIKALADEIANIEGIKHENLVKFYGVELHKVFFFQNNVKKKIYFFNFLFYFFRLKKEILIFMEFCGDKCTLDQISRESSGLPEELVRSYTNSLLKAVNTLHENNIIHRDIKGANIFLKTIDSKDAKKKTILKLGDFGSSIKFKIDSRAAPPTGLFAKEFMGTMCKRVKKKYSKKILVFN